MDSEGWNYAAMSRVTREASKPPDASGEAEGKRFSLLAAGRNQACFTSTSDFQSLEP